ncbi:alpha/beta fold hydrolase [Streptomyces sp. NPDC001978]|jgi:pimeloyl-ACP methyl ester carboxylesterase|uniref:alpha/beta fold hydrolase n=1 Tax=Streptomyces sp. NPDC001978 TaxID=3364627 RepID=UPI0036901C39
MVSSATEPHSAEGFATNGDVRIHYRVRGSGPAMLFLHGFPDTAETFSAQVEEFARDHMVITPTLRGYPPSSVPPAVEDYAFPLLVEDVAAVLDELGVEQVTLLGHDWGGGVLQVFAAYFPERVKGLAILNSPIVQRFDGLIRSDPEQQRRCEYMLPYLDYHEGDEKNIAHITRTIRDADWRRHVADYLNRSPMEGMLNYYKAGGYPTPPYDLAQALVIPPQKAPVLVVWGLEDEYFGLEVLDAPWDAFEDGYRMVGVRNAGHWVFRDQPDVVNAEIRSWLGTVLGESAA